MSAGHILRAALRQIVDKDVWPSLKVDGFRKREFRFLREMGAIGQHIDVIRGAQNSPEMWEFAVEAGLSVSGYESMAFGAEAGRERSFGRRRIYQMNTGRLTTLGVDTWWILRLGVGRGRVVAGSGEGVRWTRGMSWCEDEVVPDISIAEDVLQHVLGVALPFLRNVGDLESVYALLAENKCPMNLGHMAVIRALEGNRRAVELLFRQLDGHFAGPGHEISRLRAAEAKEELLGRMP